MEELTILITSCGAYSDMWSNTLSLFKQNWMDNSPIVLSSDSKGKYDVESPLELKVYDGEMAERIINALKDIKTKYVFLTFDDYYLTEKANISIIKETLDFVEENNISYCGFAFNIKNGSKRRHGNLKIFDMKLNEPYEVNFYPGLWNRVDLINVLRESEDIWTSEVRLTKRLARNDKKGICLLNKNVVSFLDVVRKGEYLRKAYKYLKKHGLFISDRKVKSVKEDLYLKTRFFVSIHAPKWVKNILKTRYRKSGGVLYSDLNNFED